MVGDLRERGNMEDLGVNGRIVLKLIFKKSWTALTYLRLERGGGLL